MEHRGTRGCTDAAQATQVSRGDRVGARVWDNRAAGNHLVWSRIASVGEGVGRWQRAAGLRGRAGWFAYDGRPSPPLYRRPVWIDTRRGENARCHSKSSIQVTSRLAGGSGAVVRSSSHDVPARPPAGVVKPPLRHRGGVWPTPDATAPPRNDAHSDRWGRQARLARLDGRAGYSQHGFAFEGGRLCMHHGSVLFKFNARISQSQTSEDPLASSHKYLIITCIPCAHVGDNVVLTFK